MFRVPTSKGKRDKKEKKEEKAPVNLPTTTMNLYSAGYSKKKKSRKILTIRIKTPRLFYAAVIKKERRREQTEREGPEGTSVDRASQLLISKNNRTKALDSQNEQGCSRESFKQCFFLSSLSPFSSTSSHKIIQPYHHSSSPGQNQPVSWTATDQICFHQ